MICDKCIEIADSKMNEITKGISKYVIASSIGINLYLSILKQVKNSFHDIHIKEIE